ncbi:hypothetical protein [Chryseobacterium sp. MMS23-Vi53]|uniref:hypothetical protein n=1 Tax=Chryseobacterium sp. MMS23-Vi53 TaxID=3386644 RepID=UPI0039EC1133
MMKKSLFILFLVVSFIKMSACSCHRAPLAENYLAADVVGIVKIIKVYDENSEQRTYKADVEFEKLYKGEKFKTLNVRGLIGNSYSGACEININPNETYLILLNKYNNDYSLSLCSPKYSFNMNEKSTIEALEKTFAYIEKNKYKFTGLEFTTCYDELQKGDKSTLSCLKNFSPKNPFAIYKVKINELSQIEKLTPITRFGNQDSKIENILRKNMTVDIPMLINKEPQKEFFILLLYFKDNIDKKYGEVISSEW